MNTIGFVYILRNDYVPNLVKIGYTDRDPSTRAEELSNFTGVPGKWKICESWKLNDAYIWEQKIFASLFKYRETGEFFKLSPNKAIDLVRIFLFTNGAIDSNGLSNADIDELRLAEVRNKEYAEENRKKAVKEEWEKVKNEYFYKATKAAEIKYGKTLEQINQQESSNINSLETIGNFLYIIFIPFIATAFLLKTFIELLTGNESKNSNNVQLNQYALERQRLFEVRSQIYYGLRKEFFSSRNAPYPYDDKDSV